METNITFKCNLVTRIYDYILLISSLIKPTIKNISGGGHGPLGPPLGYATARY